MPDSDPTVSRFLNLSNNAIKKIFIEEITNFNMSVIFNVYIRCQHELFKIFNVEITDDNNLTYLIATGSVTGYEKIFMKFLKQAIKNGHMESIESLPLI